MQRFCWPGYEMQLLGELQKQQNSAQFCDTLLQTEGISVPTHSCVLAAFSPYFSRKLSASPSPPCGQKRQLQLRAVTAQTLLKLVGLLYSGELEVKGGEEQKDVMAAAHRFGITGLVAGEDDGRKTGSFTGNGLQEGKERARLKMQDAQVQAEMTEKRSSGRLETKKSVSTGTQTSKTSEMSVGTSGFLSDQIAAPVAEKISSVEQFSAPVQPQNVTLDKDLCLTPCPTIPSDAESTAGKSSGGATNPTSSSLASEDPSSPRSPEENVSLLSPGSGDGSREQEAGSVERGGQGSREEMLGGGRRPPHAKAGRKNLAKMLQKEVMETTESRRSSVKVKLKRKTKGEMWEVASLQETDEALKQGCSNQESRHRDLKEAQTPPGTPNGPPVDVTSPKTPNRSSSSSDPSSSGSNSLNQSGELEPSLPQLQGSVDEADEQVERWLEDIMMGLNILSNVDGGVEKSQLNPDGASSFSQAAATESAAGQSGAAGAAGCLMFQDMGAQSGRSSADTGVQYCFGSQSQPACTSLSSARSDAQTQQRSQCFSSFRSRGRSSETSLRPERAPAGSFWSFPSSLSGQKLHFSASQQKDQANLEFVTFLHGGEAPSERTPLAALPCMDDLRLPRRLSPLEPHADQLLSNFPANPGNDILKQKSLLRRPWLTETPMFLQFPLMTIVGSQTAENNGCKADAESSSVTGVREESTTGLTSDLKERMESLSCNHDATKDAAAPRRRRRRKRPDFLQDGDGFTLASRKSKARDRRRTRCVVSLCSRNVLAKESETAASASNKLSASSEKTKEVSAITEPGSGDARCPERRTGIRTRGFLKRSQEKTDKTVQEVSDVVRPAVCRAVVTNKQGDSLLKRKRGRPRKIKLGEKQGFATSAVDRNQNEAGEQIGKGEKANAEGRKRRRRSAGAEGAPPNKIASCSTKAEGDNDDDTRSQGTPKKSWTVTLKEFQKLIKRQHSKTRKSKEGQETGENARDVEREEDEGWDESAVEAGIDVDVTESSETQDQEFIAVTAEQNESAEDDGDRCVREETAARWSHEDNVRVSAEQLLMNPDEGAFCEVATTDWMVSACRDEVASLNSHLLQEIVTVAPIPKSSPPIPEKSDPPVPGADVIVSISESSQEEEEVDIMVFSPEKRPPTKEDEDGFNNMVLSPEEEEEEEVNEVDVTGDETE